MKEFMHIGETKEANIPEFLKTIIEEQTTILDTEYGVERDKYSDDGGYVAFVESRDDIVEIESRHVVNIINPFNGEEDHFSISEYSEHIITKDGKEYVSILFLLSNDYGLVIVTEPSLLPENSEFLKYDSVRKEGEE
jgi:hypothetical protein